MEQDSEEQKAVEDLDEMHLWLGRAISDFSRIEEAMAKVYSACFTIENRALSTNCYLAINDSATRQKLTSRAVYLFLHSLLEDHPAYDEWKELRKAVAILSETRNDIAHGAVSVGKALGSSDPYEASILPYAHQEPHAALAKARLTIAGGKGGKAPSGVFSNSKARLKIKDVQKFTDECETLREKLRDFGRQLEDLQS